MSDPYFVATRMLAYQLLHAQQTRSPHDIPLLVAVLPDFSPDMRTRLELDGATVVEVKPIDYGWATPDEDRWRNVLVKLRFWQMIEYDKICFLDSDIILTGPLDRIFEEEETAIRPSLDDAKAIKTDEAPLPSSYGFAAITQTWVEHAFPPGIDDFETPRQLNAGFFVLTPSLSMFEYYLSLLQLPGRFEPGLTEQNLLNYAHRLDGNMPWQPLKTHWNVMAPTLGDLRGGAMTLHDKWWNPRNQEVQDVFLSVRWRMEGFFEKMDQLRDRNKRGVPLAFCSKDYSIECR